MSRKIKTIPVNAEDVAFILAKSSKTLPSLPTIAIVYSANAITTAAALTILLN